MALQKFTTLQRDLPGGYGVETVGNLRGSRDVGGLEARRRSSLAYFEQTPIYNACNFRSANRDTRCRPVPEQTAIGSGQQYPMPVLSLAVGDYGPFQEAR